MDGRDDRSSLSCGRTCQSCDTERETTLVKVKKYPEVRRVSRDLVRDLSGERHNHCYPSPIYRERRCKNFDRMLAERYASHPGVILWHISNEYGGECYCLMCQEAFRKWLKKIQDVEALNHAWWTSFGVTSIRAGSKSMHRFQMGNEYSWLGTRLEAGL